MEILYPVDQYFRQMSSLLGISAKNVIARCNLPTSFLEQSEQAVDGVTFMRIWEAIAAEAGPGTFELDLAKAYAHGPFVPPLFAFSCADTLAQGLSRLSEFKPLIGPMTIDLTNDAQNLRVEIAPMDKAPPIPASMGLFEILYITECARCFTGQDITPLDACLSGKLPLTDDISGFLGRKPTIGNKVCLTFAKEDAALPLLTRSPALWDSLSPGFTEQMQARMGTATMSGRIKKTLSEALPGGITTVEDMARRMNISKRSLQRRLSEEGTSFQELLNETRFEMSEFYLIDGGLSVPEISHLLGFQDTSSFFRAFHTWTGMTPGDYRATAPARTASRVH